MRTVTLKNVVLGEGSTKVIVPITGASDEALVAQATELSKHELDIVEWRVDFYDDVLVTENVLEVGARIVEVLGGKPVIFTFRTQAEGGQKAIAPEGYAALNIALVNSGLVDAVDVELNVDHVAGDAIIEASHAAGVAVIISNHEFHSTPKKDELISRLRAMQQRGADIPKIAVMPKSASDVLALLGATCAMHSEYAEVPLLTMSMGGLGVVTRLAGEVFGSCATFGMVGTASAPGQIPVEDLQPILRLLHAQL
jgi:3-dehydroquinate dehydratase I